MELIPILSLIVLVATISTFILAVGAYVLYKVRESKGRRAVAPMPQAIEAEIYTPQARMVQAEAPAPQRQVVMPEPVYQEAEVKQGRPAYAQMQPERAYQQPMQPAAASVRAQEYPTNSNGHDHSETQEKNGKFMKYTSEGYIPVNKSTKTGENVKWR